MVDPLRARHFRQFLEAEHADENLAFYVAVEAYRSIRDVYDRELKGREIICNFVDDAAATQVNLGSGVRNRLRVKCPFKLSSSHKSHMISNQAVLAAGTDWPPTLFDQCQSEVFNMLRADKFHRFMQSMFYDLMAKALQFRSFVVNQEIFARFMQICTDLSPERWELTLAEDGLEVYNAVEAHGETLMLKTRCTIYRPAKEILEVVSSPRHKVGYDHFLVSCDVLKEFDKSFKIIKFIVKLPSMVAKDRDAVW